MNQKSLHPVSPNTLPTGHTVSRTYKLGALVLAAALAMTFAPRVASADPAPVPFTRPQLSNEAAVESVMRYITLHFYDVARSQRGLSAAELSVRNYLLDHGVTFGR